MIVVIEKAQLRLGLFVQGGTTPMLVYELFTPQICAVAVQETDPVSWAEDQPAAKKISYGKSCTACARSKALAVKGHVDLLPFSVKPTGSDRRTLLVVLSNTNKTSSIEVLLDEIRKSGFTGRIVFEFCVKCSGGSVADLHEAHIAKCRPHLAYTYRATRPDMVLLCGTKATKAFLGETVSVHKNTGCWQVLIEDGKFIPVVMTASAVDIAANYIIRRFLRKDLTFLFTADWSKYKIQEGEVLDVEDEVDAMDAVAWAEDAPWLAFDTETKGKFFRRELQILCVALAKPGSRQTYVFGQQALKLPVVHKALVEILSNKPLVGHNVKFDMHAISEGLGVKSPNVLGCTRLMGKLLNSEADARLEQMSRWVGVGNHKRLMDPEVKRQARILKQTAEKEAQRKLKKHEYDPYSYAYGSVDRESLHRYCALDTYTTALLYEKLRRDLDNHEFLSKTWVEMVLPANNFYYELESRGIPVSMPAIELATVLVSREVDATKDKIHQLTDGQVDPDKSATLIKFLQSVGVDTGKRTKTGKMQTRSKDLKAVRSQHTVLSHMLEYRKSSKLLQSYLHTLPSFVTHDGKVHPSILVDGTRGGRISCKDPAMQTIPSGKDEAVLSKMVKNCFTAPNVVGDDYLLVSADYKTLEIYVGAAWSNDEHMISALKSGDDFHIRTAMGIAPYVWNQTAEEVRAEIERDLAGPTGSSPKRSHAKRLTFSTMYGMRGKTLAEELGVTVEMANDMIEAFFRLNNGLHKRMEESIEFARKHGYIVSEWDGKPFRIRPLPHIGYASPSGYISAENASKNTPIQSQAADICTKSAMQVDAAYRDLPAGEAWVMLTIHDSIISVTRRRSVETVAKILRDVMCSQPCGGIKLAVDIEIGKTWGNMTSEKVFLRGENA